MKRSGGLSRGPSYIWSLLLIALCVVVFLNREPILDWASLRGYSPPPAITALADATTMNQTAKKLFYVNQPQVEDREAFNKNCTNKNEQSLVLGCYHGNRQGIFIFRVDSAELKGVQEVTAAHEMLHQAYDRLSTHEREHIDGLLQDFYKYKLQDQAVKDQIESYKKSEPNAVVNEMHSLFGTEVKDLPTELETYYKRYFTERSKVVALYANYQAAFTERQKQIDDYDAQLKAKKPQIAARQSQLEGQYAQLEQQKAQMDNYKQSGNIAAFNAMVKPYNALVDAYNVGVQSLKSQIADYNTLVEKRNAIAAQEQQLQQELSSKQLQTAP